MRQPVAEEIEVKICLKIEIDPLNFVFNEDIFFQRVHLCFHNHLNLNHLNYHFRNNCYFQPNHLNLNHNVPNTPLPSHLFFLIIFTTTSSASLTHHYLRILIFFLIIFIFNKISFMFITNLLIYHYLRVFIFF